MILSKKKEWSFRLILRYALFQIPSLVILISILILIRHWVDLPTWLIMASIGLWIIKDIALFPLVWRAYDRSRIKDVHRQIGDEAIVETCLMPSGYVRIHGELWLAEVETYVAPIEKGEKVSVEGIRGFKLIVKPSQKE